jgi:hypothetical protein
MSRGLTALALLAGLCLLGARTAPAGEGDKARVVTKVGERKLFDGRLTVKAYEEGGKLTLDVTCRLKNKSSFTHSLTRALGKEGTFWLVYAEAPNKVWYVLYPSTAPLVRWEVAETERGLTDSTTAFGPGDVMKKAPQAVRDALPKAVRAKLMGK